MNMDFKQCFNEGDLSLTVEDGTHRFRKSMVRCVVAMNFVCLTVVSREAFALVQFFTESQTWICITCLPENLAIMLQFIQC
jgi:hypothetical protein